MVGIVIVSHSNKVTEGVKELVFQMDNEIPIVSAGGTINNGIGTDLEEIILAINKVYSEDGVVVLFDFGSACINVQMAVETFSQKMQKNIKIIDVALVEGAIAVAVGSLYGKKILEIEQSVRNSCPHKME